MHALQRFLLIPLLLVAAPGGVKPANGQAAASCPMCAEWNRPQPPFQIFGNTYYVGPRGLSSILLTSEAGLVLIDGDLPESAPMIANHIRQLGYRIEDVRLILNSHAHFDHAGGISWLQRASGATVAASPASARALETGASQPDDPQYGEEASFPAIAHVSVIADGETLQVGPLLVTARFTPGHTPGGTTWTWRSCDGTACYDIVYADSQTAMSAKGFLFTHGKSYPSALQDFQRGLGIIEGLPCDILLTPHPDVAGLWERLDRRKHGDAHAMVDKSACRNFVAEARRGIAERVAAEVNAP